MDMIINKLPSATWNWLRMNEAKVEAEIFTETFADFEIPSILRYERDYKYITQDVETGAGKDLDRLLENEELELHRFILDRGIESDEALRMYFDFKKDEKSAKKIELIIEDGAKLKVIMDYSNSSQSGFAAVQTKIRLGKGASLHLIQVQRTEGEFTFINDVGSINAEDSSFELTKIILSSKQTYEGLAVRLEGRHSSFHTDVAYLVKRDDKLDINYLVKHIGIETQSDIDVRGVLRDRAYKMFRGTIDIEKGAANASGKENESVLLVDEGVINKSIPVILCAEEDVEGAHGATIGRLDEELLFYMRAKGIPEHEVYEAVAGARIEEVCQKIEDEKMRKLIYEFIGGEQDED